MNQIRPWLYIGKYAETRNYAYLHAHHIGAMLQLADEVPQPNITTLYLEVDDGVPLKADDLRRGVAFVREQKALGKVVLVACGAGISRSVTFAAAALKEEENLKLIDALDEIKAKHPVASPHPKVYESASLFYGEPPEYYEWP